MAAKEKLEAVLNVALRVPSIMLLDVLYRWDVSSFFQQIQRSSLSNNPLFQYKYLALNMHYVGKCLHHLFHLVVNILIYFMSVYFWIWVGWGPVTLRWQWDNHWWTFMNLVIVFCLTIAYGLLGVEENKQCWIYFTGWNWKSEKKF